MKQQLKFHNIQSFNDYLIQVCNLYSKNVAYSQWISSSFKQKSYEVLYSESISFAHYLLENGLKKDDRVAIISESRLEYPPTAFGVIQAGGILVPVDTKLSPTEMASILNHAKPKVLIISEVLVEQLDNVLELLNFSPEAIVLGESDELSTFAEVPIVKREDVKLPTVPHGQVALIIYTSGTTGSPKGVMVKHSSILFQIKAPYSSVYREGPQIFLSILPLSHLYEFTIGLCSTLGHGAEVCFANSLDSEHLSFCMQQKEVTDIIAVPLFLNKIKAGIERKVKAQGIAREYLFKGLLRLLREAKTLELKKMFFKKVHDAFGGHLTRIIVGGSSASEETLQFFWALGIEVFEGYGLSETGPTISTNLPEAFCVGTVGKPLPGVEVKIATDGEVLTRGPHVMKGYYRDEEQTARVLRDGWFHTGDIGKLSKEGFLSIVGRKKKIIVLESGKKVFPEEVEDLLQRQAFVEEVAVQGYAPAGRKNHSHIVAVLVPKQEISRRFDSSQELEKYMVRSAQLASKALTTFKRPTHYLITNKELPKTSSRKVKMQKLAEIIEQNVGQLTSE